MGTYLYMEKNGKIGEAQEWAGKVRTDAEANLQTARSSIASAWQSAKLDKWLPNRRGSTSGADKPDTANEIQPDSPSEGVILIRDGAGCGGDSPEQHHSLPLTLTYTQAPTSRVSLPRSSVALSPFYNRTQLPVQVHRLRHLPRRASRCSPKGTQTPRRRPR